MSQQQNDNTFWMMSEIRLFPFGFAPRGWVRCQGQVLLVNDYPALFALIGYTFGGSGGTFHLPDLRGRVLLHTNNDYRVGQAGGEEAHVLTAKEMAAHRHRAMGSSKPSDENNPKHNFWPRDKPYRTDTNVKLHKEALGRAGGDKPHDNMAPFLSLNYCIALTGRYPSNSVDEDYMGTIKAFPFLRPIGYPWAVCDGSELPIAQHTKLFSILGNRYGGDGTRTFRLPDLRGKATLSQGKGEGLSRYQVGDTGGAAKVALTEDQLPPHQHTPGGKIIADGPNANENAVWANSRVENFNGFATEKGTGPLLHPNALDVEGESAPHNNMMPYLPMMFIIAVEGIDPPRH
ncbi:MAG: tail fiber protein [Chitinophagaceae bacterium]